MAIKTISTIKDLESLRSFWEEWQYHPNSDFDHFKLICQIRKNVKSPLVIIYEENGKPSALLAARIEKNYLEPSIGYFKPFRIPAILLTVIYEGALGHISDEQANNFIDTIWKFLSAGTIDLVTFHQLRKNSRLLQALLNHPKFKKYSVDPVWAKHWVMDLPNEPGAVLQKIKSKHRSWLWNRQRKLEAAFPNRVEWHWLSYLDDIPAICRKLESVAVLTYQRALGAGFVDNEEYRQRFELFNRKGALRIQLLAIDNELKAFWIGKVYDGIFHSEATGYDPSLRVFELGNLIFMRMVDELINEGIEKFDFGFGDAHYKRRFGDYCWYETTIKLFAPTVKGKMLRSIMGSFTMVDKSCRSVLEKLGLTDRLKTKWRNMLRSKK